MRVRPQAIPTRTGDMDACFMRAKAEVRRLVALDSLVNEAKDRSCGKVDFPEAFRQEGFVLNGLRAATSDAARRNDACDLTGTLWCT